MADWRVISGLSLALATTASVVDTPRASAYEFLVQSQTVGDAYQLVTSDNEVLNRRRVHQYLGLSVSDLTGDGTQKLSVQTLFRFDGDFGLSDAVVRNTELRRDKLSIQSAYVEGKDLLNGWLAFKVGRHMKADQLDYLMLDGVTLDVNTPFFFGIELEGGAEVREDLWSINANQLQPDGTRYLQRDGTEFGDDASDQTLLEQQTSYVLGAAIVSRNIDYGQYRFGYRRVFSGAVDTEKVGGAFRQRIVDGVDLSGLASWDMFNGRFDRVQGQVKWRIVDWTAVELEYTRLLPSFDADSIFNIFTAFPMNDVNLRWRLFLNKTDRIYAGAMVRFFGNEGYTDGVLEGDVDTVVKAWGGSAGYSHSFGKNGVDGRVSADISYDGGYGGKRLLADVSGTWAIVPGEWELEGRVTAVDFDDDMQTNLHAFSFGYQLGGRYLIDDKAAFAIVAEHNMNRLYSQQVRVFALVDVAVWL